MHPTTLLPLFTFLSLLTPISAKCCGAGECVSWNLVPSRPGKPDKEVCNRWKCADGKHHGPFQCCGVSKCNVFCCNCDSVGGKVCRVAKGLLSVEDSETRAGDAVESDEDMFAIANTSGTGNMTIEEFASYFGAGVGDEDLRTKFHLYDMNGDGFLQAGEMRLE